MGKQTNILILSAGRRVELVKSFRRAKEKLNIEGKIFAADAVKTAPALYFADEYFLIPRIKADNYITELIKLCRNRSISLVVPTIDTELEILAENRTAIEEESGAKLMISDCEVVKACCDKIQTARLLTSKGFCVPKVITEDMISRGDYRFPLFIKPLNGSSSINAFKINDQKQLSFFREYVESPIIQQFVNGTEYTVDCFCDFEGNAVTIVPRIRIATRSGEILKGKIDKNGVVIKEIRRMLEKITFRGHITVQGFLTPENEFSIVEINPRFGGGAPMSIMAGADSCENLYRLLRGEKLAYNENYEDGVVFSRFDDSIRVEE